MTGGTVVAWAIAGWCVGFIGMFVYTSLTPLTPEQRMKYGIQVLERHKRCEEYCKFVNEPAQNAVESCSCYGPFK